MSGIARRDAADLSAHLDSWLESWEPGARAGTRCAKLSRPSSGWSNDTLLVSLSEPVDIAAEHLSEIVVRSAPAPEVASYPVVDFVTQQMVMGALRDSGIPTPEVLAIEADEGWLGVPFMVMRRASGRSVGDSPAGDPWLASLSLTSQRRVHERYIDALAAIHRLDPGAIGLRGLLRDSGPDTKCETSWWCEYVEWAAEGSAAPTLAAQAAWCARTAPQSPTPRSLCWGDPRLGNALLHEDGTISALLDWELASIGSAELDLGWYLALDRLTSRVTGCTVPGFLSREKVIARYEQQIGRAVEHLDWHEIFALVRSAAVNDRQARLAARVGVGYPGIFGEDNPMLHYVGRLIERYEARG